MVTIGTGLFAARLPGMKMRPLKRILHIEDDREIGSWVSEALRKRGYEVK